MAVPILLHVDFKAAQLRSIAIVAADISLWRPLTTLETVIAETPEARAASTTEGLRFASPLRRTGAVGLPVTW